MMFGVSSACFYPQYTEEAIAQLVGAGVKNIEFFVNSVSELSPPFLQKLRALLEPAGAQITGLHPFTGGLEPLLFFSQYARRAQDGIRLYHAYFRACRRLGGSYLVLHGDLRQGILPEELYFERFDALARAAQEEGVQLLQENVCRCKSADALFLAHMKEALPNARFVLDIKQALRSGLDPFALLDLLGERIEVLHLSDNTPERDCLLPGQGSFAWQNFLRQAEGYPIRHALIEVYSDCFSKANEIGAALSFLQSENRG